MGGILLYDQNPSVFVSPPPFNFHFQLGVSVSFDSLSNLSTNQTLESVKVELFLLFLFTLVVIMYLIISEI